MPTPKNPQQESGPTAVRVTRPLRTTLTLAFLAVGLVAVAATALLSYYSARQSLEQSSYNQLRSVRETLQASIEGYLRDARYDLASQADSDTVRRALAALSADRRTLIAELGKAGFTVDDAFKKTARAEVQKYYDKVLVENLRKVRGTDPGSSETVFMHPDAEANILQYIYTVLNPKPVGSKSDFTESENILKYPNGSASFLKAFVATKYASDHDYAHRIFTDHRVRFGYYDIFICDLDGYVVYTNFKELDFQGNLKTGPEQGTGLGKAYAAALKLPRGETVLTELAPYAKSYDAPAIFAATPIYDGETVKGAFIYQLPLDRINATMTFNKRWKDIGLGETGECYLVGLDGANKFKQITESRFGAELATGKFGAGRTRKTIASDGIAEGLTTSGVNVVETEGVRRVVAGGSGDAIYPDYRPLPVLGSFSKLNVPGLNWAILAEIDEPEAFAAATRLATIVGASGAGLLLLIGLAALLFARRLTTPVAGLRAAVEKVAAGDESARAPVVSKDEIGQLAHVFNGMVGERAAVRQKLEEENRRLQANIQQLLVVVADASDGNLSTRAQVTEGALGNVADALNLMFENVGDLIKSAKSVSEKVNASATNITSAAAALSAGSAQQSTQLEGVGAGARDLAAEARAVAEASREATTAAEAAAAAADRGAKVVREVIAGMEQIRESVQVNGKKIKRLGERSMEIGGILRTINEISAQTDMLALNASIEAGRAGEAGRGFTAVAEQVRALAERAKGATQQIEKLVSDIQQETSEAVAQVEGQTQQVESGAQKVALAGEALSDIVQGSVLSRSVVSKISAAAERQTAKTGEMIEAVSSAAGIAQESRSQVGGAQTASEQLSKLSKDLDKHLSQFQIAK